MGRVLAADVLERVRARATVDARFVDVLAELVDAPATDAGELAHAAAVALDRERRADARARFCEGAMTTAQVQAELGLGTPQAVHRLRSRGRLIGLPIGNATWFPAWQLRGGALRPDLPELLALLGAFTSDPIAADRVMRLQRDELGGRSLAEALDRPRLAGRARALLESLGG